MNKSFSEFPRKMQQDSGCGKLIVSHILAASFIGAIGAAAAHYRRRKNYKPRVEADGNISPRLSKTESGHVRDLETFSNYVARQMGLADENECPQLSKLAYDYLRKSEGCDANIFGYFENEPDAKSLCIKLIEEFDRCILAYFAFHWNQATHMITQVLSDESHQKNTKLKSFVMAATRKQRFEKVTKDLKVTRAFSILVDEIRAIRGDGESTCIDVMAPKALSERSPVLLLMGGGMGAGKSSLLKLVMKESFWLSAASHAVVVEADAFKERDVIYQALHTMGHHDDMLQTSELVHQSSTDAASSLLVTALNEGRDVVLDSTLSWEPFVEQTIAMARNVHKYRYRMGVGYRVNEDGTVTENYWEQDEQQQQNEVAPRKPYRIELVGVVCDAYLAVIRGIRRAIIVGRAVRVNSQLTSHKRFAGAFPRYCRLVDSARLYCTNTLGGPPMLIAWKDGDSNLLVDPDEINSLAAVSSLNDKAQSVHELYSDPNLIFQPGSMWKDVILCPSRASTQQELRNSIQKIEKY